VWWVRAGPAKRSVQGGQHRVHRVLGAALDALAVHEDGGGAVHAVPRHRLGGVLDPLVVDLVLDRPADGILVGAGCDRRLDQGVVIGTCPALGRLVGVKRVVKLLEGVDVGSVEGDEQGVQGARRARTTRRTTPSRRRPWADRLSDLCGTKAVRTKLPTGE